MEDAGVDEDIIAFLKLSIETQRIQLLDLGSHPHSHL